MKTILFAVALSLGVGATTTSWACDCEHKKKDKACSKGDCKNCSGSCNPANQKTDPEKTPPKQDPKS